MKFAIALISFAAAQVNTDGPSDVARPDWQKQDELTYGQGNWKTCEAGNCTAGTICVKHNWEYNGQTEAGEGCWNEAVCSGNGAYDMFDGRKLQFFCSDEQTSAAANM